MRSTLRLIAVSCVAVLVEIGPCPAADNPEERSLVELRDTVVNLLQALVERGVITREQAEAMIRDAKTKADAEVAANTAKQKAQDEADKGAVRVPYVPEIVKDQIRKEVVAEIEPEVKKEVAAEVSTPDNLRSVLPDWVQRMHWTGDVRARAEGDNYGKGNAADTYLDFNAVNSAGGIVPAGNKGYLDTTEDVDRLRLRLRFGFDVDLGSGFSAAMRMATGSGEIFASTNQTLGTYGQGYNIVLDQGYIRYTGQSASGRQISTTTAGRFASPWLSSDLVWYNDLTFEGVVENYRLNLSSDNEHRKDLFFTAGAFPLQAVTPSSDDKWLAAGQIGADLRFASDARLRLGAAYYDYIHISGERNAPDSTLFNYTAPALVQKGNTLFDISNSSNPNTNLFALAAGYRIVDLIAVGDWPVFSNYFVSLTGQAVRNVGYNSTDVFNRTGEYVAPHVNGYRADLGVGSLSSGAAGSWRASVGYRYLQRDAVLDAFNDEDFHLGGTDAKGYAFTLDYFINPRVWIRSRYLSADAIDGPPLAIDVWQVDLNTQF